MGNAAHDPGPVKPHERLDHTAVLYLLVRDGNAGDVCCMRSHQGVQSQFLHFPMCGSDFNEKRREKLQIHGNGVKKEGI